MRILILDSVHPVLAERLTAAGHACIGPDGAGSADVEGLVVRSSEVGSEFLKRMPKLRFVGRVGSGVENIDVAHCDRNGIRVLNSPEGNRDGVGESCVLLLLALMKSLVPANAQARAGIWSREANRGTELRGKTVGIIGYGQMGSAFAEKLRGFGVRVLAHDKYKSGFDKAGVRECSLAELLGASDVISLHLPLTTGTQHYANDAFFHRLRQPVWFLNTSRGRVVHTRALLDAIEDGRVIAAGLDVLEFERADLSALDPAMEPGTQQRLLGHPRVLITPHIAGVTHEGRYKLAAVLANKIIEAFPNDPER
ncbi:MAG TPA: NAD(P)-dependent oxidoreductase [Flavobacteriales bacterium]|nr:NAD(P)-dependent oxidoreductase [Flavobacteriales bacterium]